MGMLSGLPSIITKVLTRESRTDQVREVMLEVEGRVMCVQSQGTRAAPRSWKRLENGFSSRASRKNYLCQCILH